MLKNEEKEQQRKQKFKEWIERKNKERKMRRVLSNDVLYKDNLADFSRSQSL